MAQSTPTRWVIVALGLLAGFSLGCSPASLAMLVLPWMPNNVDPDYKLFAKDKEITLVLLVNFAQPPIHPDHVSVKDELPDHVAQFFRKRCQENKHKIKIVSQVEARSQEQRLKAEGTYSPDELGKHFKADFVLELNVQSCSLYEKNHFPKAFRGVVEMSVHLHKLNAKDEDDFHRDLKLEFPTGLREPIDSGSTNPTAFRRMFLTKVARDVTKLFIAFPADEKHMLD
jgi:hypothetical protein